MAALNAMALLGRTFLTFLEATGRLTFFIWNAFSRAWRPPFYFRSIGQQMIDIGYYSLPIVGLTAIFAGMVLALQSNVGLARFDAESQIPEIVAFSITRELGPVLAGLMVAGRIGASMAAEIGTMRVTEQIDALVTLATDPFRYLVFPRLLAGILTLPLLVLVADVIGIFGGFVVSVQSFGFNPVNFISKVWEYLVWDDVFVGMVKASVFGFIVTLMGCYQGFNSRGGAEGVGRATTNAVVAASILILVSDYFLSALMFGTG